MLMAFWREMREMELTPDVKCYTALLDNRCKLNNIQDAIFLLDEMIDRGMEPDTVTYTALLSGYFRCGDIDGAVNE